MLSTAVCGSGEPGPLAIVIKFRWIRGVLLLTKVLLSCILRRVIGRREMSRISKSIRDIYLSWKFSSTFFLPSCLQLLLIIIIIHLPKACYRLKLEMIWQMVLTIHFPEKRKFSTCTCLNFPTYSRPIHLHTGKSLYAHSCLILYIDSSFCNAIKTSGLQAEVRRYASN